MSRDLEQLRTGSQIDGLSLEKDNAFGTEKMVYSDILLIRYSNGVAQQHPLEGVVPVPSFRVSTDNIDFGVCFVGQMKHHQVSIVNLSGATTSWRVQFQDVSDTAEGEFQTEPSSGVLDAFVTHTARNKETLTITFVARSECRSEAAMVFEGDLGEPRHVIKVTGSGSFDGQFEMK
ncbi:unnamed protein product [Clavelina lepadiformis]|uniref:Uncharacterized protein n=1 Tax=Clavelina lepadiformis TaxID=159417 RepID=A0ABP0GDF1_CLALP